MILLSSVVVVVHFVYVCVVCWLMSFGHSLLWPRRSVLIDGGSHDPVWFAHDFVAEVDERVLPGALGEDVGHVLT